MNLINLPNAMKNVAGITLMFVMLLAACQSDPMPMNQNMGATQGAPPGDEIGAPQMRDGVQVVHIEAGHMGYAPKRIALEAGVPARLVFKRTAEGDCLSQVQIPELGITKTDLPLGEEIAVDFTPEEGGEYTFVCGMDMVHGTLVVKA